jgi:glyoxylase-like metal-dependent hydrolase (beta-lactamase superfamily II)
LQHKFLLAKPCLADTILQGDEQVVDHIPLRVISLPGHSIEQVGVAFGDTLFAGDTFLVPEILDKHRIPFYTDMQAGLTTLTTLKTQITAFKHIVAGHGEIYSSAEQASPAIAYTIARLESILDNIRAALADGEPRQSADILSAVASQQGATINALPQYVLYNTTVQSGLSTLYARGEIYPLFQDNHLEWQRGEKA